MLHNRTVTVSALASAFYELKTECEKFAVRFCVVYAMASAVASQPRRGQLFEMRFDRIFTTAVNIIASFPLVCSSGRRRRMPKSIANTFEMCEEKDKKCTQYVNRKCISVRSGDRIKSDKMETTTVNTKLSDI